MIDSRYPMKASRAGFLSELQKIEQGDLNPVYLLWGGDLYLEDQAINSIYQAYSQQEGGGTEKLIFYGEIDKDREFIDSLFSIGFFATRRVIIYKNIGKMESNLRTRLFKFIENPGQNTLLIMTTGGEGKSSLVEQIKKMTKTVKTISTWTPDPKFFSEFVRRHLNQKNYEITDEALNLLILLTDDSLSHTIAELEKLLIYIDDRKTIEEADVRLLIGGDKEYDMWEFVMAVAERDIRNAVKIGLALIRTNTTIPYFITQLYEFFSSIWDYEGHGQKEQFWKKQKCVKAGLKNYRNADFGMIFAKLRDVDLKSKSVNLYPEDLLIPLLYDIIS